MKMVNVPGIGEVKATYLYVAGGGVVALVAWSYWRSSSAPAGTDAVDPGADPTGLDAIGSAYDSGTIASGGGSSGDVYGVDPTMPTTDSAWVQYAAGVLGDNGWDPALVVRSLGKYLAGQKLTAQEAETVTSALGIAGYAPGSPNKPVLLAPVSGGTPAQGGQPKPKPEKPAPTKPATPTPAKPNPGKPAPATPKPRTPARPRVYTIRAGDTLSAIAKRYRTTVAKLVAANRKRSGDTSRAVTDPDKIYAGETIVVG